MRSTLIAVIVVTVLSVALCLGAGWFLTDFTHRCDSLREEALELALAGDREGAASRLRKMRDLLEERAWLNEIVSPHDALHDVGVALEDAEKCLQSGDIDDFDRAIGFLGECLEHIRDVEELRASNVF